MDQNTVKVLHDKQYDRRKAAALDIEKIVREAISAKDEVKIQNIVSSLAELLRSPNQFARCGALMGLAGVSIALGEDNIPKYIPLIIPSVLDGFSDPESKVRYFACESMYNLAKVAKGEILVYFNEIFDVLAKLAADNELPVKNGADLLDRLMKDIVTEVAATYVPLQLDEVIIEKPASKAFSVEHFIPLLKERMHAINPFVRMYLVSWLTVLDSVPDIELITFLPDFLEGLIAFLADPTDEIRTATQNVLADFLQEIKDVAKAKRKREQLQQEAQAQRTSTPRLSTPSIAEGSPRPTMDISPIQPAGSPDASFNASTDISNSAIPEADEPSMREEPLVPGDEGDDAGLLVPGQNVVVRHAEILEVLLKEMVAAGPDAERESLEVCLQWIAEFLHIAQDVVLSFTPRLIPLVMSALAHHRPAIRGAAHQLNISLFSVIAELPSPEQQAESDANEPRDTAQATGTPGSSSVPFPSFPSSSRLPSLAERSAPASEKNIGSGKSSPQTLPPFDADEPAEGDPIDWQATVAALCTLLGVEEEESRLAALHWLSMLHGKAPKKILSLEDGTFPALLKTLSDQSEEVIKSDLQLLAQISSASSEEYFTSFMVNLVRLFSTDRPLLEHRGRTIIGQLCVSLNTERIYRTFAEILERDEDLEFASLMVQNLNLFLITLPELADFRKRLKNIDNKDGSLLFAALYRSWSHNAVSTLSLCFLAQAYEHASNLLQVFAELEMTVSLLIQIDKLVQLLESTVFTSLRLQLLEPDKYPHLHKALYGLLMLLPQSTAFFTLRNRLNSVNALGFLHAIPRSSNVLATASTRSVVRRPDDIKWQDLLTHFKTTQLKHERQRRVNMQPQHMHSAFALNGEIDHSASPYNFPSVISANNPSTRGRRKPPPSSNTASSRTGSVNLLEKKPSASGNSTVRGSSRAPSVSGAARPTSPPSSSMAFNRRNISQNPTTASISKRPSATG